MNVVVVGDRISPHRNETNNDMRGNCARYLEWSFENYNNGINKLFFLKKKKKGGILE